jgi:TctA family transporter
VDFVKGLLEEGNIRRLIIRKPDGDTLLEVPLSAGIAVGGILTLMAPILAALGAMAALVAKVQVEIERRDEGG